jgi:hypothetical protein
MIKFSVNQRAILLRVVPEDVGEFQDVAISRSIIQNYKRSLLRRRNLIPEDVQVGGAVPLIDEALGVLGS